MERTLREALRRVATRVIGSRFAMPIARVVVAAAGLALLAFIGRTAIASAIGKSATAGAASAMPTLPETSSQPIRASSPAAISSAASAAELATNPVVSARGRASADDPVVLNVAAEADLKRLPGIGAKRANAILALRARLGRFRAVEDLLKVKGIGRATLRRLRPLLRLDPSPPVDAGLAQPATSSP